MDVGVFIFHRDLSIEDNLCFHEALNKSDVLYPIFIFDPRQINPTNNKYFSKPSAEFMLQALYDLEQMIPLTFIYLEQKKALNYIHKELHKKYKGAKITVYENADFTPFAKERQKVNQNLSNNYYLGSSITLKPMGEYLQKTGECYKKFTPFYTNALNMTTPNKPLHININKQKLNKLDIPTDINYICSKFKLNRPKQGPLRKQALQNLKRFIKDKLIHYEINRNIPSIEGSTRLSAHLHFGVISPRELYWALNGRPYSEPLITQLYWREFYMYIINYIHTGRVFKGPNEWHNNMAYFKAWCEGRTGIPLVDAGMRQLNQTGYMHNRLRMVVAMFLIHYLKIDWRLGEQYFATKLADYSYCNNLGGWLWCFGFEVYANPYFRIFSIEQQMKRFDPEATYVKKWVPELEDVPAKELYNWPENYNGVGPKPIIQNLQKVRLDQIKYLSKR